MASDNFIRRDENTFFSFTGDNGKSVKATAYTSDMTNDKTGEVKSYDLIEIRTTKNQYDEASKKTFVKTGFITIARDQFESLAQSFLEA